MKKDKPKYIEIVQFYQNEIQFHEQAIAELKNMLDQLESQNSFKEMDYSCGAINLSAGKEDEK